ncbi:hypothetical protein [Asaia bogorensis]|uniref:hypothetical protein n=1 Tax=Asaia bogorensis TaxID=91915 RepID=UPI0013C4B59A|nr:hypothetical protein [Asaia bogorensis]
MIKLRMIMSMLAYALIFPGNLHAEENKCYFPDIPSFIEGKILADGRPADLSFADYRTINPKGAALLLSCARAMYNRANLSQFNDASRRRLDRTMETAWQTHDIIATVQKDNYIALGGSSKIGSANDMGTMIIDPDKKLVAVGLLFNNDDKIDASEPANHIYSNFAFIYDSSPFVEKQDITINEMHSILELINKNIYGLYVIGNEYFIGPKID